MLKKTIKYTDLDGNPAEEDAYFNLTKAEAIELNIRNDLEVIGRSRNNNEIMDMFKRILKFSYGLRTSDGKFIKDERDFQIFAASEAYSELFMEIFQNPEYAIEFIKGILPKEVSDSYEATKAATDIPQNLATHPSMQGHLPPQAPKPVAVNETNTTAAETPEQIEARVRAKIEAEMRAQTISHEAPPAQVSLTPEATQQPDTGYPPRDQLV